MNNFQDIILYKTKQHKIVLFTNFLKGLIVVGLPFIVLVFLLFNFQFYIKIIISVFFILLIFFYFLFFWNKSIFIVTNKQISLSVRNGLFSNYSMCIYFENIRDIAYSKNNIFHYIFNYGTFFARSSAGAEGDFIVTRIPNIEKVYKIVNYIHMLPIQDRKNLNSLESLNTQKKETINQVIEKEKKVLLLIKGIKEVVLLDDNDRKYIFENEEDRNHGIYETIKRKVVFCFTHDSSFRDADAPIVLKFGKKVIFPAVSFHEINRPSIVSSSPGLKVHQYLSKKFNNLALDDATVLVGFDL